MVLRGFSWVGTKTPLITSGSEAIKPASRTCSPTSWYTQKKKQKEACRTRCHDGKAVKVAAVGVATAKLTGAQRSAQGWGWRCGRFRYGTPDNFSLRNDRPRSHGSEEPTLDRSTPHARALLLLCASEETKFEGITPFSGTAPCARKLLFGGSRFPSANNRPQSGWSERKAEATHNLEKMGREVLWTGCTGGGERRVGRLALQGWGAGRAV